jgi:hypothetical protein
MQDMTLEEFQRILPTICDRKTAMDSAGWTPENPLWSHCAAVALLAHDLFGGDVLRASLEGVPKFAQMRSHYVNRLPDGTVIDFTRAQFGNDYPEGLDYQPCPMTRLCTTGSTVQRYMTLRRRLHCRHG